MTLLNKSAIAGGMAGVLALTAIAVDPALILAEPLDGMNRTAVSAEEAAPAAVEETDDETALAGAVSDMISGAEAAGDADKQETVYVFTDAKGAVDHVTVSAWLKNPKGQETLSDVSDLKNITNLKGDETYTQSGDKLTWQADGHEIFYQGESDKKPPVSQTITYYLDGKEIEPDELAGKSGEVKVHIDYVNQEKSGSVCTPFTVAAALVFDNGQVKGVKAEHGSVMTEGKHTVAVSVAFPGLKESLESGSADKALTSLEIPESAEFTMEAEDFSLPMCLTVVLPDVLTEAAGSDGSPLDQLRDDAADKIGAMEEAGNKLTEGSAALSEGIKEADDAMPALTDGADKLSEGVKAYTDGVSAAKAGADKLSEGASSAVAPAQTLADGVSAYTSGVSEAAKGAETLGSGIDQMKAGADQLVAGYEDRPDGSAGAVSGSQKLADGLASLNGAVSQISLPEVALSDEQKQAIASQAAASTADGAAQMSAGVDSLVSGIASSVRSADASAAAQAVVAASPEVQQAIAALVAAGYTNEQAQAVFAGCGAATAAAVQGGIADSIEGSDPGASLKSAISGGLSEAASQAAVGGAEAVTSQVQQNMAGFAPQIETLKGSVSALSQGAASLNGGVAALYNGTVQLDQALARASEGAGALNAGMGRLDQSSAALAGGAGELSSGIAQISSGAAALDGGLNELTDNSKALNDGSAKLADGAKTLASGMAEILAGSIELKDGTAAFNDEAIDKIAQIYHGDVEGLINSVDALKEAAASYKSYSGVADGAKDHVTFIYKAASIG